MTHYLGTHFVVGPKAELPDAGNPTGAVNTPSNHIYIAADTGEVLVSNGHAWTAVLQIGIPVTSAGNGTIGGTLYVTGATTLHTTLAVTGAATLSSTLAVTGAANLGGATSFGSRIIGNNASTPTLALAAGAGDTPPAAVLGTGGNDTAGAITFGTGTTAAAGDQVAVTFGTAYPSAPKTVIITAANAATAAKAPLYVASITTTGFTVGLATAPADSQANTVYAFSYLVVQ